MIGLLWLIAAANAGEAPSADLLEVAAELRDEGDTETARELYEWMLKQDTAVAEAEAALATLPRQRAD